MAKYEIIPADENLSNAQWQEAYSVLAELERRYKSTFRSSSWRDYRQRLLSHIEAVPTFCQGLILEDGRQVGWISFMARNPGTSDQAAGPKFDFLQPKAPDEMVRLMTQWIAEHADQYQADTLFFFAWNKRLWDIAEAWNGKHFASSQEYALYKDKADRATIDLWIREIPKANPDLSISFHQEIPDDLVEDWAALMEQAFEDLPEDDVSGMPSRIDPESIRREIEWRKKNEVLQHVGVLIDSRDRLVGLTEVGTSEKKPQLVDQRMTAVARGYRGRGLAKWLKSAMFLEVERRIPLFDRMITWMRTINEPIQHINKQIGFVAERQAREYRVSREGLRTFLN